MTWNVVERPSFDDPTIEEAFRDAVWMLDRVFDRPSSELESLFCPFFHTRKHIGAVLFILKEVHVELCNMLVAQADNMIHHPLRVERVPEGSEEINCDAYAEINFEDCLLSLYPLFFAGEHSIQEGLAEGGLLRWGFADDEMASMRGGTIIHELVHWVSYYKWMQFVGVVKDERLHQIVKKARLGHIQDFDFVKLKSPTAAPTDLPANGHTATTITTVEPSTLAEKPHGFRIWLDSENDQVPAGEEHEPVTGMEYCRKLAEEESREMWCLLNADNYACFAAAVAGEWIRANTQSDARLEGRS